MFLPGESQGRGNLVGCRSQSRTRLKRLSSSSSSSQKMESWAEKSPKLGQGYVKDEWTEAASWIKGGRKRGMFQNIFISSCSRNPAVLSALGSWRFSCILSVASSLWASSELQLFHEVEGGKSKERKDRLQRGPAALSGHLWGTDRSREEAERLKPRPPTGSYRLCYWDSLHLTYHWILGWSWSAMLQK